MIQLLHSWNYTQRTPYSTIEILVPLFTATLFIIARKWNQPNCPSANEWIIKTWYISKLEYSTLKINEVTKFAGKWMDLGPI